MAPAVSKKQRRMFAIAEHSPSKLKKSNKGVLKMPKKSMHDFASTKEKGLPHKKKAFTPKHQGDTFDMAKFTGADDDGGTMAYLKHKKRKK